MSTMKLREVLISTCKSGSWNFFNKNIFIKKLQNDNMETKQKHLDDRMSTMRRLEVLKCLKY